jgi:uncharacterized membrane protein
MSALENLKNRLPSLRSRWWTALLGLSLMVNLLLAGAIGGSFFNHHKRGDFLQQGFVQLVPRKFMMELPADRRKELMQVLREGHVEFKSLRKASQEIAVKLADALDNYDEANVKSVIANFTTGSESIAAHGGAVVADLIAKLTPEERKLLAADIRERDNRQQD